MNFAKCRGEQLAGESSDVSGRNLRFRWFGISWDSEFNRLQQLPDRACFIIHAMPRTREEILRERRQLKAEYGDVFDSVAALLFRHDPIGIAFENENTNEYEPEAGTILPRLRGCASASDVLCVVHEEFCRWFGSETAGSAGRYAQIADETWQLWQARRGDGQTEGV